MTMLTGKLRPFTGQGKLLEWRVTETSGKMYIAVMTVQDATHAARCGVGLDLVKKDIKELI